MSEISAFASLLWFVPIAVAIVTSIRAVARQCSQCLRQVSDGRAKTRNDLKEAVQILLRPATSCIERRVACRIVGAQGGALMDEFARVASLLWFVVIGVMFVNAIARAAAKECPRCLRPVFKGQTMCPACGAAITARTDLTSVERRAKAETDLS